SVEQKSWLDEKTLLEQWRRQERLNKSDQLILVRKKDLLTTVDGALKQLQTRLAGLVELSRKLSSRDVQLYELKTELDHLIDDARGVHFEQTSPSIFSKRFYRRIRIEQVLLIRDNIRKMVQLYGRSVRTHIWIILFSSILAAVLAMGISFSGRLVEHSNRWFSFSRRPVATSLFVFLSLFLLATTVFSTHHLTAYVEGILSVITIGMIIRLSGILVDDWLRRYLLLPMACILILTHLLKIFHVPAILVHLYIFIICFFGVLWYLNIVFRYYGKLSGINLLLLHTAGIFSLAIVVAESMGYGSIALYLFRSFLYSVIAALDFRFLFLFTQGLLELFFYRVPLGILKKNSTILARQCVPALSLFYIVLFFLISLVNWQIYPTIYDAAASLANVKFSLGGFVITPGYILTVLLVVYGSIVLSRMLQALLLQEVLPRYGAEIGVQLSITRLVHYAVMVVGFLVLLRVLGVQLNKLAILGGALGVGIGFGLQAIVNNFASGLILLFERPIKVGDMIQVGNDMGEVKKLGLRATVVRTFDNADIVIPNSDLITGQVTNWTLADRHIRVKVPVGVAYGTDIAKVLEILQGCAENNPMVLNQPKARALFLAFGDSSLDFELRVWIAEFTDRRLVLSELNQDIESEFSSAGIEIPFPQTDVHFRSLDDEVLEKIEPTLSGG
ncbi:MAG TPA: mechanosensitive ion channel family protein, partial [Desulfobulbaceae bacterium]|nr:mechanosensitive ion channel family protein [Desulfobulbaceae bacterium]